MCYEWEKIHTVVKKYQMCYKRGNRKFIIKSVSMNFFESVE